MAPSAPFLPLLASAKHADIDIVFLHALLGGEAELDVGATTATPLPAHRALLSALGPPPLAAIADSSAQPQPSSIDLDRPQRSGAATGTGEEDKAGEEQEPSPVKRARPQHLVSLTYPTHPLAPSLVLKWIYAFPCSPEETAQLLGITAMDDTLLLSAITTSVEMDARVMGEYLAEVLHARVTQCLEDWKSGEDEKLRTAAEERMAAMLKVAEAVGMEDLVRDFASSVADFEVKWPKRVDALVGKEVFKAPELPSAATAEVPTGETETSDSAVGDQEADTSKPTTEEPTVPLETTEPLKDTPSSPEKPIKAALQRTATALRSGTSLRRTPTNSNSLSLSATDTTAEPSESIPEDPTALKAFLEMQSPSNALKTVLAYIPLHADLDASSKDTLWDAVDWPRLSESEWDELLGRISSGEVDPEVGIRAVLERTRAMADAITLDGADLERAASTASTISPQYGPLGLTTPATTTEGMTPSETDNASILPSALSYMNLGHRDTMSKLPLEMVTVEWAYGGEPSGVPSPTFEIRQDMEDEGEPELLVGLGEPATEEEEPALPKSEQQTDPALEETETDPITPKPTTSTAPLTSLSPSNSLLSPPTTETELSEDDDGADLNRAFSFQHKKNDESQLYLLHQSPPRPASYAGQTTPSNPTIAQQQLVGALPPRKGSLATAGKQASQGTSSETLIGTPGQPQPGQPAQGGKMAAAWLRQQGLTGN